jgi:predicted glycosyltransferase
LVGFFESFFEPHSTKHIEDCLGWGLETDGATLADTHLGWQPDSEECRELCARIQCPTLVIHGTDDRVTTFAEGEALAKELGTRLEVVEGSGHGLQARKPVQVNLAIRDFLDPSFDRAPRVPKQSKGDPKRALFITSPIGLGHARRDLAIAQELRAMVPDLQIDWLAQDPVTRVLEREGETIHPASAQLASESRHIECESAEHDLHCFQALRRMDEILVSNFMVFHDVMREGRHDLVIGDEAWEVDYYLHENPNEKRAPYVWLTDFVGFIPMNEGKEGNEGNEGEYGGDHEAFLTADYNAEMIEHIASQPQVRDRAIFVGNPDDVVPRRFGPDLPWIREWTEKNFDFSGYVTGFDPAQLGDRGELRRGFGYREDEKICIVSVGGSGVGRSLIEKVMAAYPEARRREPALRMIVVAGPRIDPASLPAHEGLEVVAYVHDLYRNLAACDLAVVQGGLTTSMELAGNGRPFLYFPLAHHFEQNVHVRHRLDNYGAGRCMDYASSTPDSIAQAIAEEVGRPVNHRPVETDGALRAAERIADLL